MKPLAVFLQASSSVVMKNYIIYKHYLPNPTLGGLTTTSDIVVRTTLNGLPHEETYPAGTTSIAVQADPQTEIKLIGDISSVSQSLYGVKTPYYVKARSGVLTSFSYSAGVDAPMLEYVDFKDCKNLITIDTSTAASPIRTIITNGCKSLQTLKANTSMLEVLTLGVLPALTTLDLKNNPLSELNISGCTAITTLNLSASRVVALDLSALSSLENLNVVGCRALSEINFGEISSVKKIEAQSLFSLKTIDITRLVGLEYIDISQSPQITALDVNGCAGSLKTLNVYGTKVSSLNFTVLSAIETLKISETPITGEVNIPSGSLESFEATKSMISAFISQSSALKTVRLENSTTLSAIEIAGSSVVSTFMADGSTNVGLLKARAVDATVATYLASCITGSNVTDGVVYLNSADQYYSTVETAAQAKGWTIEAL